MAWSERLAQTAGYCAAFVCLGLATAALGPTLPDLAEQTQAQLSQISFLFTASAAGYLLGSLQGGRLYDRIPGHSVMGVGLLIVALMLAMVPVLPRLWLLVLVELVLGMAAGAVDVGGNVLVVWVHGRGVGPYMNALHFFFGLGSFLSPLVVIQAVLRSGDITWAYWALALLITPIALWLLRLPSPAAPANSTGLPTDPHSTAQPRSGTQVSMLIVLLVLLFFLYVGAEVGFGGWLYTYATAMDLSAKETAAYLTSAFWGALTLGRLLSVPIAVRVRPRWTLTADLVGCLVSVGILFLWPDSLTVIWLGTFGLGLSMASFFPTLVSLAGRRMIITGQITGWFLAASSVGGMFLPWLIGQLFEPLGPRIVIAVIGVDLLAALSVFAALMIDSTRQPRPNEEPQAGSDRTI